MPNFLTKLAERMYSNAYLLLTITALFWAGNFVVGRGVYEQVPPVTLAWFRWLGAFLIILPFAYKHVVNDWPYIKKHWKIILTLGVTGVGTFNTLVYIGINYTTAINGLIMNSSSPMFMAIMAFFLFKERLSTVQLFGILLSVIGVLTVVLRGDVAALGNLRFNIGDLIVLGAFFVWAFYTVMLKLRPAIHGLSFLCTTFLIGVVTNTPFFMWEMWTGRYIHLSTGSISALLYVAIFPSILAYICYNRGVQLIGSNRAGAFLHVVPLFGALLAVLTLGEKLELFHLAGFVLIISGVILTTRKPAPV